jgi:hypothetical protein
MTNVEFCAPGAEIVIEPLKGTNPASPVASIETVNPVVEGGDGAVPAVGDTLSHEPPAGEDTETLAVKANAVPLLLRVTNWGVAMGTASG